MQRVFNIGGDLLGIRKHSMNGDTIEWEKSGCVTAMALSFSFYQIVLQVMFPLQRMSQVSNPFCFFSGIVEVTDHQCP